MFNRKSILLLLRMSTILSFHSHHESYSNVWLWPYKYLKEDTQKSMLVYMQSIWEKGYVEMKTRTAM